MREPTSSEPAAAPAPAATKLCIKWTPNAKRATCSLCNAQFDALIGANLFIDGTRRMVCNNCGLQHDPFLTRYRHDAFQAFIAGSPMHGPRLG